MSTISEKDNKNNEVSQNDKEKEAKKEKRKQILEQMEFYFSDSNLSKDRFLKQEISTNSDGFIPLNVFLNFNKIRTLTTDLKEIVKSLKKSNILELNENLTMVKRKIEFIEPSQKDIDKKTIYVENLETNVNDQDLKKFFSQFGQVCYVSLPSYNSVNQIKKTIARGFKTTNQLKGFAFIEFCEKEQAKKAIEFFEPFFSDKNEEASIGKFPRFNAQIIELEKKIQKVLETIDNEETKLEEGKNNKKRENNDNSSSEEPKLKIKKTLNDKTDNEQSSTTKKAKFKIENDYSSLRVVSKRKWLKLKEEYLSKQKSDLNQLKDKLSSLNAKLDKIRLEKLLPKNSSIKTDDIVKGCIIKLLIDINNPLECDLLKLTRQQFKEKFLNSFLDEVVYVDLEKNSNHIFLRCKSPEAAKSLMSNSAFLTQFRKELLVNEEEMEYFKKIYQNRNKKMEKKNKKDKKKKVAETITTKDVKTLEEKVASKPKIAPKTSTHVVFD